jgi:hypothetical protein
VSDHLAAARSDTAVTINDGSGSTTVPLDITIVSISAADGKRHLLVHPDLPYRDVAPGIQFLLAVVVDCYLDVEDLRSRRATLTRGR